MNRTLTAVMMPVNCKVFLQQFLLTDSIFKGFKQPKVAVTGDIVVVKGGEKVCFPSRNESI
ncbi:hypothetical protein [Desulfoscipio gibsoniae]|uniref:hypothetical protein n=1 Tax=Desulfoscipio gibsoniae TaxID=102134 RepID=UPI0012FF038D|nr:hypothetical protein [Desulfoscipio gibsoniae]